MKKILSILTGTVILAGIVFTMWSFKNPKGSGKYVILAWNELGMHCANKYFGTFAVLPPYNNVRAQVVLQGSKFGLPKVITKDLKVSYEIPGNTYSVGKTDFWTYAKQLFGVQLADNIGLTGEGLTGFLKLAADTTYFVVQGIPITPYTDNDLTKEDPYQLGLFKLYDSNNTLLAQTQNVIPVSNEISCVSSGCHSSEANILSAHRESATLTKPVLCASCHSSNALGTTGTPGLKSLSEAVHGFHAQETPNITCYNCHPGKNTQCLRDTMFSLGYTCTSCHGSLANVASTIAAGRRPWLDEPSCAKSGCHSSQYAPEPGKLYRESKGHGGLFCTACHGSPHAITPTVVGRDNLQNITLQGYKGPLSRCKVCHGIYMGAPGPHGLMEKYIVEGNLTYDNSVSTPISSTLIQLYDKYGNLSKAVSTDITGYYFMHSVPEGSYTLVVTTPKPWESVDPGDALMINRNYIGAYTFETALRELTADVNDDKAIDPGDALMINRRYIGAIPTFTLADWLFPTDSIIPGGDDVLYNIKGICAGDVNGSNVPLKK